VHLTQRKLLLGVAVIALAGFLILVFMFGKPPAVAPLPNPNGYDDFLKAASLLAGNVGNAPTLDQANLRALILTNTESLRLLRLGLSRECALPADVVMTNMPGMLADLANLKSLAQLLAAEGRLHEMENDTLGAARNYVDAIRFGNAISRGGFVIHRLVGIACEAIGNSPLSKLVPKLGPNEARQVIGELEKIDREAVGWDEVQRNESRFARHQMSKGFNPFTWVMSRWQVWRSRSRVEVRNNRVLAHSRLMIVELALRCSASEHGHPPANLTQLVPTYLQAVPLDPFSGRAFAYRPQGNQWLLYSIGEDGVDDGGKPAGRGLGAKGDVSYDSPY
jgi:hypothetical protein